MSTKSIYIERLKSLKKLGVLPKLDARKTLTDSQKRTITENWKKYHKIANAVHGEYVKKDISHYEPKQIKEIKSAGYKVINGKIFIDAENHKNVSIKRDKLYNPETHKYSYGIQIIRSTGDRKTETEFIGDNSDIMNIRDKFLRQYERGEFKHGDFIGIKLYDNGRIFRRMFHNMGDVYKYALDDFTPKKGTTESKDELIDQMRLVKVSINDFNNKDFAANRMTPTEINRKNRIHSKNRKKTATNRITKNKSKSRK